MDLRLLGPIEASVNGHPVPLGTRKQRALLAMLALRPNETVSADRLVDGLWGDAPPASAGKMVQLYVSQLRRAMSDGAEIVTHGRGYELRIDPEHIDAVRFERLVERASAGASNGAARAALSLWRGTPLPDVADEPFAPSEIHRLEGLRLHAAEMAIDADLAAGRHNEVVGELEALIAEEPLRERLHAQLMLALYRSGRQAEALQAYHVARRALIEQIGVEPGPDLRELHERILGQDPELAAPGRAERRPAAPHAAAPPHVAEPQSEAPAPESRPQLPPRRLVLVAALVLAAGLAVFLWSELTREDHLDGIGENAVGVIDPDENAITGQVGVGRGPTAVAAGGGSVWVANSSDGTISRIDRDNDQISTIDVGGDPTALAFGEGSLWVADGVGGAVAQVDTDSNRVTQRFQVGNRPVAVAVTGRSVWVATAADAEVVRIDLRRGGVGVRVKVGASPTALAMGGGALWVATEEGAVVRIEPGSGTVSDVINVGNGPAGIAEAGGALWVANRHDGTVSRVDPAAHSVSDTVRVGREPLAVAAAEDAVWVANAGDSTLTRIDLAERRVAATVQLRGAPGGVAAAEGKLWVSAGPSSRSHRGGTLRLHDVDTSAALDPLHPDGYTTTTWQFGSLAFDGLVAFRRVGGAAGSALVGALATGVPRARDGGRTYVFRLRPGLRYSDGRPVRVDDFRRSMERMLRVSGELGLSFYGPLLGARECVERPARCDLRAGIRSDSQARTITVRLSRPDAEFLHKLTLPFAWVVPPDTPARPASRPLHGTGPYRIAHWDKKRALLVRNPRFRSWSEESRPAGYVDRIEARFGRDEVAARRLVQAGRSDLITLAPGDVNAGVDARLLRSIAARGKGKLHFGTLAETDFAFLNASRPPFDDVRVRRAVNYAVDRGRLSDILGGRELAAPTCQILPPGLPGYRRICPFTLGASEAGAWAAPDVARARSLVKAAGATGARVEFVVPQSQREVGDEFVRAMRVAGLRARAKVVATDEYFPYVSDPGKSPRSGISNWYADYPAPANFLGALFSCDGTPPAGPNFGRFCDRGLERRVKAASAAPPEEAGARWHRIERELLEKAAAVPIANRRLVLLASERAGNVQSHPQWIVLLDRIWVR